MILTSNLMKFNLEIFDILKKKFFKQNFLFAHCSHSLYLKEKNSSARIWIEGIVKKQRVRRKFSFRNVIYSIFIVHRVDVASGEMFKKQARSHHWTNSHIEKESTKKDLKEKKRYLRMRKICLRQHRRTLLFLLENFH